MKLVWTKSKTPLSLFIRWMTGEDCSHFAFVFEGPGRSGLMFESNLLGTHPAFFKTSLKTHEIVHEKDIDLTVEQEDAVWDLVVERYDGKPYDFGGALYLGIKKLMHKLFNSTIPTENKWSSQGKFFCDEIYDVFNNIPGMKKIDVCGAMQSPHDVFLEVSK